jgi:RNA polymerase sigma-70 factor (ECF subfamily)
VSDALSDISDIYDTHAPRVYRYIYHRLGDRSLAEDLTGEVFVRFLGVTATPDNVLAFLYRIAHNLIVDYLRHNQPACVLSDDVPADQTDPAHLTELEMERARLRHLIARLTPDQQQVVILKFLEGAVLG